MRHDLGRALPPIGRRDAVRRTLRNVFLPFRRRAPGVRHLRNIPYGPFGYRNRADVYLPRQATPVGVFVHFHGGHFRIGRKDTESLPLLYHVARQGWIGVSANYRLQPAAAFPDFVVDAKRAIAWSRRYAAQRGADPDMVVASGDSAGAHLALFTGLTGNNPRFQPGFEGEDTRVSGIVPLYGYYGPTSPDPASSPLAHLQDDLPPTMMVHGGLDTSAPVAWARGAVTRLREVTSSPLVYAELPGAQHNFDYLRSPRCDALLDATSCFLGWLREDRRSREVRAHG